MNAGIKNEIKHGCGNRGDAHENPSWGKNRTCSGNGDGTSSPSSYCATKTGQWIRVVRDFVKLLKYGEVHLTVHKGRVIEVRKVEKVRFDET